MDLETRKPMGILLSWSEPLVIVKNISCRHQWEKLNLIFLISLANLDGSSWKRIRLEVRQLQTVGI